MSDSEVAAAQALSDEAVAYQEAGRLVEAQAKMDEALAVFRHAAKLNPEDAAALNNLTVHLARAVQIAVARNLFKDASACVDEQFEVSAILSRMPEKQSSADWYACFGAHCLGDAEVAKGRLEQAVAQYQRAADLARQRLEAEGESAVSLALLVHALLGIADVEGERVPVERAYASYLQIAELAARLERVGGDTPTALNAQSVCHSRLGSIEERRGHLADAADQYRRSHEALQRWSALADQETPALKHNMATVLLLLAGIELRTGRPGEALRFCGEAMRHARAVDSPKAYVGRGAQVICNVLHRQGDALWANGEPLLARQVYAELYDFSSRWVAQEERVDGVAAQYLGLQRMVCVEKAFGDTTKAYDYAERALAVALQLHSLSGDTVQAWSAVMLAHKFLGDLEVVQGQEHLVSCPTDT